MANFVRVAATSEIPAGQGKAVEVNGKTIAVFNCDGAFYAIDNTCKHQGGPLGEGELEGTTVICPWHGWTYDVTTGVSPDDPDCAVGRYEVKVEGDSVLVAV
ncbi:MAG TPA: Rieske 2Fe-2S domain-containing protein [Candidatus Acidoferrales bacterium]|nr:Rieske 2Fe-2S domain-containing protein [Candidatus Acidoferrales bacterium]